MGNLITMGLGPSGEVVVEAVEAVGIAVAVDVSSLNVAVEIEDLDVAVSVDNT